MSKRANRVEYHQGAIADVLKRLAAPQGLEPRYADPELMDRTGENLKFHADKSITYLHLKRARSHFDEVLKGLD